ncbi:ribonuclease H-like domain-containing protein [Cercophora samala]|uniref:Ribonuclease H-like domain-containing protein n=1 Tax=Cercophora samala TaxID=330535 RepID=A0AA39Z5G1_9PEZI|nr:ribonuclease H-like domain-containing protein [Cercophora samala]
MVVFDLIDEYYATPSPPSTPEPRVPSQITIIDTTTAMAELVETLPNLPTSPPSLYVDLEGKDLGRNGTIAIMQLHVLPTNHTYLIDVHTLQDAAFTTPSPSPSGSDATTTASPSPSGSDATTTASPSPSGSDAAAAASPSPSGSDDTTTTTTTTFKSILESPTIPKVFFDVRHDSDALYHLYGINLAGVQDLQLMEHAQSPHKNYVRGLAKCIQYDAGLSRSEVDESQTVKAVGKELWSPELGGSFDVFAERPMRDEIVQYCAQDAWVLPLLYERYEVRIGRMYGVENLRVALAKETEQRIFTFICKSGFELALGGRGGAAANYTL